jgi:hypothetical protein
MSFYFTKLNEVITELKLSGTDTYNVEEPVLLLDSRGCKVIAPEEMKPSS